MKVLFLDDIRVPGDVTWIPLPEGQYTIVRNFSEFVDALITEDFDHFCLDYDLFFNDNHQDYTGLHCLQFLLGFKDSEKISITLHTQNVWGKEKMEKVLNQ